jgi:hypothetical protein
MAAWWSLFANWWSLLLGMYGLPLLVYLAFALPALYYLKQRDLDDMARAVWALTIVAVPVMGTVAFALVKPGRD